MAEKLCKELVQGWYLNNPARQSGKLADNALFRMLYNSFCRRNGIARTYADVVTEGAYAEACAQLFGWYQQRYARDFSMSTGTKGQKRTVDCQSKAYSFDLLYCDDRQFRNYLVTDIPQSGSQDLFSFVLHTAVAFLVPPGELDGVLQHLGFHPLHVKNIHHLAIYYVLLAAENRPLAEDYNPFAEVRALHEKAREILEKPMAAASEGYRYGRKETRLIRQALFLEKELRSHNFEDLVSCNKTDLNTRHSLILSDFHRLISVFLHIYDASCDADDVEHPDREETGFSFYVFVEGFCKDNLTRKKYREQLTGMIDLQGKHPTRSVMILLWLYAFCFSFSRSIYVDRTTFRRITKQLALYDSRWADEAKAHLQGEMFDIFGFLTGAAGGSGGEVFRGSEFVAFINEILTQRYGWGPLNARIPFDYYILKLGETAVRCDASVPVVTCRKDRIADIRLRVDNVPDPLAAIVGIMVQLKAVIAERNARIGRADLSPCPLKCSLYEQI